MAQVELGRNTSNVRPRKSRNWQFTLNNYTPEEIKEICDSKYQYIFQEETGSEGTPHLQGMISSANAVSFNSIKQLIPRAHIEAAKNKNALINYCQKGATRTGKIYCNVDSWLSGTKTDTTQDPRSMNFWDRQKFLEKCFLEDEKENEIYWNKLIPTLNYEYIVNPDEQ